MALRASVMRALDELKAHTRGRLQQGVLWLCLAYTLICQFATNSLKATIGDATLFAYGGRLILNGAIPYRDFWDNKPPGIFYIEAFSYWLLGTTWLAPTIVQGLVYLATVGAMNRLGGKLLPGAKLQQAAFLVLFTLLMNQPIFIMDGSNLTQDYVLLPTALAIGLLGPLDERPSPTRWGTAGFLAGCAFLIRPNALAIGGVALVSIGLRWLIPRRLASGALFGLAGWPRGAAFRSLSAFALGGLIPIAATTAYFARYGAHREMWFATLTYNVTAYKEVFLLRPGLAEAKRYFMFEWRFGVVALYAIGALGLCLLATRRRSLARETRSQLWPALLLSALWALGDLSLTIVTGHPYAHYVFMLVPSAALFGSFFFREASVPRFRGLWRNALAWLARAAGASSLVMALSPLLAPIPSQVLAGIRRAAAPVPSTDQQVALYIRQVADPTEPIMTLGHFHGHMMYLGNPSAVPLMSTFHLKSNYGNARWTPQYIRTLEETPPRVVVITDGYWNPYAARGPVRSGSRARDKERPKIEKLVREKYAPARQRFAGRRVFVRKDVPPPKAQANYLPLPTEATSWF